MEGVAIIPMTVKEQYIGIIVIGLNKTRLSNIQDNLKMLSMIGNQAAIALYADYLRQNQARLILDQRLKDASTMARKVVHEVNTPLSIIKNYTKILEKIRLIRTLISRNLGLSMKKLAELCVYCTDCMIFPK